MIFVTVGNFPGGFDRLAKAMDAVAETVGEEVVAQIGETTYRPCTMKYFAFAEPAENEHYIKDASLVVAHAGAGTIIKAQKYGTPIVIMPRRKKYGEHYTDHQMELCRVLDEEKHKGIFVAKDADVLTTMVLRARMSGRRNAAEHSKGRDRLVVAIGQFLRIQGLI